jgi:hypothetical protein
MRETFTALLADTMLINCGISNKGVVNANI